MSTREPDARYIVRPLESARNVNLLGGQMSRSISIYFECAVGSAAFVRVISGNLLSEALSFSRERP